MFTLHLRFEGPIRASTQHPDKQSLRKTRNNAHHEDASYATFQVISENSTSILDLVRKAGSEDEALVALQKINEQKDDNETGNACRIVVCDCPVSVESLKWDVGSTLIRESEYTDDGEDLSSQLDGYLAAVPSKTAGIGATSSKAELSIPTQNARAIIAPHAGFSYSGPAAAWAYKAVDWSNAKRIFLLGPSHHWYLNTCALSRCTTYETPLGDLKLDLDTIAELEKTGNFKHMTRSQDEDEHSLEMHLPYIYKMLSLNFRSPKDFPPLVPILVGSTNPSVEKGFGQLLAKYLADPTAIFIASSDFCHWGERFSYTYYEPGPGSQAVNLSRNSRIPSKPAIHESIAEVDMRCVDAVETGVHDEFLGVLQETGNTVCGRHPIGVIMAAIEVLEKEGHMSEQKGQGRFNFVRYERSSLVHNIRDSSVSYCSAFAIL